MGAGVSLGPWVGSGVGVGSGVASGGGTLSVPGSGPMGWMSCSKAAAGVTSTGYQPRPSTHTSTQAWAARSATAACRPGME
mgnify:FL=1